MLNPKAQDIGQNPLFPAPVVGDWNQLQRGAREVRDETLEGGDWKDLNLVGVYFNYSSFGLTRLTMCRFNSCRFKGGFGHCTLRECDFSHAHFEILGSRNTLFTNCSFQACRWGTTFTDCIFENCNLTDLVLDSDFPELLIGSEFKGCTMSEQTAERLKALGALLVEPD